MGDLTNDQWTTVATVSASQMTYDATYVNSGGADYSFRVTAANEYGASAPCELNEVQTANSAADVCTGALRDGHHRDHRHAERPRRDDGGEANLTYTCSVVSVLDAANPAAPGESDPEDFASFSGPSPYYNIFDGKNITVSFTEAGTYTLGVTITDATGLETTSQVSVTVVQTVDQITVSPRMVGLLPGDQQQFTAVAYDQFDSAMTTQPAFTWSTAFDAGTISQGGLLTAGEGSMFYYGYGGGVDVTAREVRRCPPSRPPPPPIPGSDCPCYVWPGAVQVQIDPGSEYRLVSSDLAVAARLDCELGPRARRRPRK